ncbi:2065_t:CDS:2 [Funneliformis geosporum]|nr:2065_t:CDS:2 [Funneliformis geosporum]
MKNKDFLLTQGTVTKLLRNNTFNIECDNGKMVKAGVAARFRTPTGGRRAKLVIGDRVMIAVPLGDLEKGQIKMCRGCQVIIRKKKKRRYVYCRENPKHKQRQEIPVNKNVAVALTRIYGIGKARAQVIINNINIQGQKKVRDLVEEEVKLISKEISKFLVEGQLKEKIKKDISKQARIGTYRGLRLSRDPCPLPLKQSTRHNGRTARLHGRRRQTKGIAKTKKIKKVSEGRGIIHGTFSFNNTILDLSKENGDVLTTVSAGSVDLGNNKKVTGTKKGTPFMAEKVAKEIIRRAVEFGVYNVELHVKKVGAGRDTVIKTIQEAKSLNLEALVDTTPIPLGGEIEETTVKDHPNTASFVFRHLPTTMGVTIGNYLRRILISCVSGLAPVGVIISDKNGSVTSKYTTLEGVVETTVYLISNLKQIILEEKKLKEEIICLEIKVENKTKEERIVTAGDFLKSKEVQIKNPELYLATVAPGGEHFEEEENVISLDADYSPVKSGYEGDQVNFEVNTAVVSLTKEEEELTLTVSTNGAVKPKNALLEVLQMSQNLYGKIIDSLNTKEDTLHSRRMALRYLVNKKHLGIVDKLFTEVYNLCLQIPKGYVSTYKFIAEFLNSSPRAVGQALKNNPSSPIIPCHRIIASNYFIGGFWGE